MLFNMEWTRNEILRYLLADLKVPLNSPDFHFMQAYLESCFERCITKEELASFLPIEFKYFTLQYKAVPVKIDLRPQKDYFFELVYYYKGLNAL